MPSWYSGYRRNPPTCRKKVSWSIHRGGCRFRPGHKGPCKPGRNAEERRMTAWAA